MCQLVLLGIKELTTAMATETSRTKTPNEQKNCSLVHFFAVLCKTTTTSNDQIQGFVEIVNTRR